MEKAMPLAFPFSFCSFTRLKFSIFAIAFIRLHSGFIQLCLKWIKRKKCLSSGNGEKGAMISNDMKWYGGNRDVMIEIVTDDAISNGEVIQSNRPWFVRSITFNSIQYRIDCVLICSAIAWMFTIEIHVDFAEWLCVGSVCMKSILRSDLQLKTQS